MAPSGLTAGCRLRRTPCEASDTSRRCYTPWRRPGSGSPLLPRTLKRKIRHKMWAESISSFCVVWENQIPGNVYQWFQGLIGAGIDLPLSPLDSDAALHLQMKKKKRGVYVCVLQTKPKGWLYVIGPLVMNRTWMPFKCCMSPGSGCASAEV